MRPCRNIYKLWFSSAALTELMGYGSSWFLSWVTISAKRDQQTQIAKRWNCPLKLTC
ncbi:uncharacterized protein K460DRAFT_62234 [Cucurbitaria berberidis CBS 394.84]|uniref:Uncharacterized protein n=1 Tax=Cucurbitaria berberidis CBS 394.84 TaxID=1168544 RepID=A0A9P4GL73_9PLEO|nr:uncharacterized protein K460DRAFT_62234 [Cucurbitaria berberidis CBS 394.84]KAF1847635.1 hypothetical protein K460DRAFT_62234 [Cucurbitaria berberidis CBS 394.84]